MKDKQDTEFPIAIRLIDLKAGRVSHKQLTYDEFLKVAAALGTI